MPALTLSPDEVAELTGYRQSSKQIDELRARGFWRARLSPIGRVILERAHYEAVCAGTSLAIGNQPQLRAIR